MKVTRIALAVLSAAILSACSSDVTGPANGKPTVQSADMLGTMGPRPDMLGTLGPRP
jgi:hypothetical protein